MQTSVASNLASQVAKIRAHTDLPVAVGFWHLESQTGETRGVVVGPPSRGQRGGDQIAQHGKSKDLVKHVGELRITGGCGEKHLETTMNMDNSISEGSYTSP